MTLFAVASARLPDPKVLAPGAGERIFAERLKSIAGQGATDCGIVSSSNSNVVVADCGIKAFQNKKPFSLGYSTSYGKALDFAYGVAGDANGNVSIVTYGIRRFPAVAPNKHTQLADDNHTRVTECVKPIRLDKTGRGELTCILPVNQEESDKVAHPPGHDSVRHPRKPRRIQQ
jgi:CTP:molybdopterin cytidylyltransferase MocA